MSTEVKFLIAPAVIALLIKLMVLVLYKKGGGQSSVFFTMVLIFAGHNLSEVLAFLQQFYGDQLTTILRWYYVMSFCTLAVMLLYAREVSQKINSSPMLQPIVISLTVSLCLIVFFSDLIVAGSKPLGLISTAIQGTHYWLFQLSALFTYIAITWYLVTGYLNSDNHIRAIQCSYTLFAFIPILIVGVSLVILMSIGIHVNAVVVMPITSTLFLLITLKSESKHKLTDIRRFIPYSIERKTSQKIMNIFSSYAKDEVNYRESLAEIEKLLVTHKHNKNKGNVSTTASSMEIPRSSLYSIFRRLNIEHTDQD